MKIVIIGDGKVGHRLTTQLSEEDCDLTLIDRNDIKLNDALNKFDIICITGDGADAEIQKQAKVGEADLVIACASTDELNMLSCLIAKKLGAKGTIARVRNPVYFRQINLLKDDLHLNMVVNPELTAAQEIEKVIMIPETTKVETFMKGRVDLVEFPLKEDCKITGLTLSKIYETLKTKILVCAVVRNDEVFIPDGNFVLKGGDKLHITAPRKDLEKFFTAIGQREQKIKNVLICGGGHVTFYLTRALIGSGRKVKIIERDKDRSVLLAEAFPEAVVIRGDGTDHDLLIEEGIKDADALVALTSLDEENIILSLFAKSLNVPKIIAKVNEESRSKMVQNLGIDSAISAKYATADLIISYVRARQNSLTSANVETLYQLVGGQIEAMEFIIQEESEYTGVKLKDLKIKPNHLVACIGRKHHIIIPDGNDHIEPGDSVIVVTKGNGMNDFSDLFVHKSILSA
ncbi:MAG: Trk system potassium transporter TrkA [Lachnospiraceae bacterium]|nr:Trk system potassium transporter TrkA [Lachnospiraceae bacterium]